MSQRHAVCAGMLGEHQTKFCQRYSILDRLFDLHVGIMDAFNFYAACQEKRTSSRGGKVAI